MNVANFAELKSAIESETVTEIFVTEDITFTSGARVNILKSSLVIDFNGHTVIDSNTLNVADAIYVPSTTNTISVTVKNAIWSGRNYYGVVGVYDGNTNTTINLQNISYTGPQFVYNKNGATNLTDCTVILARNGSSANPQEFCESNRLTISGNVSVDSGSTSNAVIWFTNANAALTVLENATFSVSALSTYFLYTDVAPVMTFKQNSKTTITTKSGLFYAASSSSHIAASFTLEENASFISHKTSTGSAPMFKCLSNMTLAKNSIFQLFSEVSGTAALVYFGQVANLKISSPKSVVLYNNGGNVFSFQTGSTSSPNQISIDTEILRLWSAATTPLSSAGGITDTPTSEYHKTDFSPNLTLSITSTNSKLLTAENNLTSGDTGYPLTADTLNLLSSKVISMGTLELQVDQITDLSPSITGTSDTLSNIMAQYDSKSITTAADASGNFTLPLTEKMPVSTKVLMTTNKNFLTKFTTVTSEGSVSLVTPNTLKFRTTPTKSNLSVVFRQDENYALTINDTRTAGDEWFLYCHILSPLTSQSNTLDNALVFKQNGETTILSSTPLLIYTGKWNETSKTTTLSWQQLEGFLLNLDSQKEYPAGEYSTSLLWQVTTTKL